MIFFIFIELLKLVNYIYMYVHNILNNYCLIKVIAKEKVKKLSYYIFLLYISNIMR